MNLAHSRGVTKKVSYQLSLNLSVSITDLGPLVESFLLWHGPALLCLDQLCGPDTIVVTIRRVAVTTHAALRTLRPALWPSFVPPGGTLEHQGPMWAKSLCESWPKSLDRFEPVGGNQKLSNWNRCQQGQG